MQKDDRPDIVPRVLQEPHHLGRPFPSSGRRDFRPSGRSIGSTLLVTILLTAFGILLLTQGSVTIGLAMLVLAAGALALSIVLIRREVRDR